MSYYGMGDNCCGRGDYYRGDYYRGDPGLFGFLKKAAGFAIRTIVPGGGAALDIAGALLRKKPPGTSLATIPQVAPPVGAVVPQFGGFGSQVQTGGLFGGVQVQQFGGGGGGAAQVPMVQGPDGKLCQLKGYHVNKGRYFTRAGVVEPGTKCVKNRRMNVTNPHALRRAIRRGRGFVKIARKAAGMLGYSVVSKSALVRRAKTARR